MEKYRCVVADDETLARELITAHIEKIPNLEIVTTCTNAIDTKIALEKYQPDILFLDIQMPNLTGLELIRMLKRRPAIVLTTAYSEHAIESYELEVADYLLKPIEFDRFFQAVSKAAEQLDRGAVHLPPESTNFTEEQGNYFFVKSDHKIVRVDYAETLFIEALQKYVCIYTESGRIITLVSMSQLESSLPVRHFTRIHRSYIVNLNKIDSIEGNMVHIGKHHLPLSKGQRDSFLEIVKKKGLGW
ncbi:MAG: LytTR family DNA-binding domain-containing protein [Chitinophagales bacterium]|nr:LytTR family DNA-binding domain-containing protein [Chitinophagales bacterium]